MSEINKLTVNGKTYDLADAYAREQLDAFSSEGLYVRSRNLFVAKEVGKYPKSVTDGAVEWTSDARYITSELIPTKAGETYVTSVDGVAPPTTMVLYYQEDGVTPSAVASKASNIISGRNGYMQVSVAVTGGATMESKVQCELGTEITKYMVSGEIQLSPSVTMAEVKDLRAEMDDARKGYDGEDYGSVGEAVRGQVHGLLDSLCKYTPNWTAARYSASTNSFAETNSYLSTPQPVLFSVDDKIVNTTPSVYRVTLHRFSLDGTYLESVSNISSGEYTNTAECLAVITVYRTDFADMTGYIETVNNDVISIYLSKHMIDTQRIFDGAITFDKLSSDALPEIRDPDRIKQDYIVEEIKRVKAATLNNMGVLNFVFSTDQHINAHLNTLEKIKEVAELANVGQFDFVAMGGDLVNGDPLYWDNAKPTLHTKDSVMNQIEVCSQIMNKAKCPVFFLQGNHDTNFAAYNRAIEYNTAKGYSKGAQGYIDPDGETVTSKEWFRLTNNKLGETVVWDSDNPYGGYFYKDFDRSKIRVICLQTNDVFDENDKAYQNPNYPFVQQKQFDWFCHKALNFMDKEDRSEWSVITISHADPFYASVGGLMQSNDNCTYNQCASFQQVLNAFINGTTYSGTTDANTIFRLTANVDFTQQGTMEFICSINGHSHGDMAVDIPLLSVSRPTIQTANASTDQKDYSSSSYITAPERVEGTISSELFDVFSIDKENRKIKTIRFGAGEDREIRY